MGTKVAMNDAAETMHEIALIAWFQMGFMDPRRCKTPGTAYNLLSEETKAKLRDLKSDDIANIRLDLDPIAFPNPGI